MDRQRPRNRRGWGLWAIASPSPPPPPSQNMGAEYPLTQTPQFSELKIPFHDILSCVVVLLLLSTTPWWIIAGNYCRLLHIFECEKYKYFLPRSHNSYYFQVCLLCAPTIFYRGLLWAPPPPPLKLPKPMRKGRVRGEGAGIRSLKLILLHYLLKRHTVLNQSNICVVFPLSLPHAKKPAYYWYRWGLLSRSHANIAISFQDQIPP